MMAELRAMNLLLKRLGIASMNRNYLLESGQTTTICFNPSLGTLNQGDTIIAEATINEVKKLCGTGVVIEIPTHYYMPRGFFRVCNNAKLRFVCGSNLVTPRLLRYRQWKLQLYQMFMIKPVILFGVGMQTYSQKFDPLAKYFYGQKLAREFMHSVRDEYTVQRLKSLGISNVINTGCATTWMLTPEHCRTIPTEKSDMVVFTLTDSNPSLSDDKKMIEILLNAYKEVYFWPQGAGDTFYYNSLIQDMNNHPKISVIGNGLNSYDEFLKNTLCDYVGSRLHGGMRALRFGRRALVLTIDNRAVEMAKDINLNVLERQNIRMLQETLDKPLITDIRIPQKNIDLFREQFL